MINGDDVTAEGRRGSREGRPCQGRKLCVRVATPRFGRSRRRCKPRRNSPPSCGIGVGAVLRRLRGPHSPSARCRWPAFALLRSCSSQFRFSRLKPTHVEALAGTVGALAATGGLRGAGAGGLGVAVALAGGGSAGGGGWCARVR